MITITTYTLPHVKMTIATDERGSEKIIAVGAWYKDQEGVIPLTEAKTDAEAMDFIMKAVTYGE